MAVPTAAPSPSSSARDWLALKAEKEAFVSNLEGTTKREVFFIVMTLPLCALVAADLSAWLLSRAAAAAAAAAGPSRLPLRLAAPYAVDFALLALPQVALTMAAAGPPLPLPLPPAPPCCFAAALAAWLLLVARRFARARAAGSQDAAAAAALAALAGGDPKTQPEKKTTRLRFVSAFRGGLMLLTCASILAVDFRAFPRRLAKAENYGQGLMDVGVGAFVFAAGLVMRPAAGGGGGDGQRRRRQQQQQQQQHRGRSQAEDSSGNTSTPMRRSARLLVQQEKDGRPRQGEGGRGGGRGAAAARRASPASPPSSSLPARLAKSLRASAPVAALGLIRLLTTKAAQYAEHVGEYGVHWNFFLTVAVVGALAAALPPRATATPVCSALLSAALLSGHQALLSLTPLGAWVQAERRGPGWVSLNKEGLASLPGYLGLLLLGAAAGGALREACEAAAAAVEEEEDQGAGKLVRNRTVGDDDAAAAPAAAAPPSPPPPLRRLRRLFLRAVLGALAIWALALLADGGVERVSRRACNAAYALWVSALCASTLLVCMAGEAAVAASGAVVVGAGGAGGRGGRRRLNNNTKPAAGEARGRRRDSPSPPLPLFAPLLCALNRNMLAVFLGANLLTGAVNLLTDTLAASDARARLTVALYLLAVGAAAAALDARGVDAARWLLRR